jgi:hypothetical protein
LTPYHQAGYAVAARFNAWRARQQRQRYMPRLTTLLADWADLNGGDPPAGAELLADALRRACAGLPDQVLGSLPATPDEAAAVIADTPFADRLDGVYLPWAWLEPFCAGVRLPIAELEDGWDISDGEDVYWCPRVLLADDPDSPEDRRAFVRVDAVRRWPSPR